MYVEGDNMTQMLPIADSLKEVLALLQIIFNCPGDIKVDISNNKYYIIYLKVEFESSRGRVQCMMAHSRELSAFPMRGVTV